MTQSEIQELRKLSNDVLVDQTERLAQKERAIRPAITRTLSLLRDFLERVDTIKKTDRPPIVLRKGHSKLFFEIRKVNLLRNRGMESKVPFV
jgi:hypothetical protein